MQKRGNLQCEGTKDDCLRASEKLNYKPEIVNIHIYPDTKRKKSVSVFPRCIYDLDHCVLFVTKYEPDLDERHPGYGDKTYVKRRKQIGDIALNYRQGEPIPKVQYTEQETATWSSVYRTLRSLFPNHASQRYLQNLTLLEEAGIYGPDKIPQLEDVSKFLKAGRGSTFCLLKHVMTLPIGPPIGRIITVMTNTQVFVEQNNGISWNNTDVIHELIGHVPMFADPVIAQFSQELGLASLGASDDEIEKLATLYWFTIEFGICKENGKLRAYGAGLLSAYGELQHALSDTPKHVPFEPNIAAVQAYQDEDYQPLYFVTEDIENALEKLRSFARKIRRPFAVIYDPVRQKVECIRSVRELEPSIELLQQQMGQLCRTWEEVSKKTLLQH